MTQFRPENLVFLDFEACSLSDNGWPVEIGLSTIVPDPDGFRVETWSSLIRPDPDWDPDAWSDQSERIHGISRADLDEAPAALSVARDTQARLDGKIVICDAPAWDGFWLRTLISAANRPGSARLTITHLKTAANLAFDSDAALDALFERLGRTKAPHRAGPDSARLAGAWVRALTTSPDCPPRP